MARKSGGTEQSGRLFGGEVPKMPDGCYSGDQPNPCLRAFVEQHLGGRPFDPEADTYGVPAFSTPIEATKATAIYGMHSYHQGKKPHDAIQQYIRHYTSPGDLVLDPFCGSGSTALAALMEGRTAIAIDRSPAATFIAKNYCTPVDVVALQAAFKRLKSRVRAEMGWLYETRCDRCGGAAMTKYTVYSQVFECIRCAPKRVALFDCPSVVVPAKGGRNGGVKTRTIRVCPDCHERGFLEEISTRSERYGSIPVLVSYECLAGCMPKCAERRHDDPDASKRRYFEECDLAKIGAIEGREIPHWYPQHHMMNVENESAPWGVKWRAGTSSFRTVAELYTKRNLWALGAWREGSLDACVGQFGDVFRFALNGITLAMSKLQGYVQDPRFPNQLMRGTYYVPQIGREYNVGEWLEGKVHNLVQGYRKIAESMTRCDILLSTQSAVSLAGIQSNSVDYVFTDPPYADTVQYGEMNFVWEAWLGLDTHWHPDEIIVNNVRGRSEADWRAMMLRAMSECFRVLRPGRWLSLCYHDTSEGTWALVQDLMAEAGFLVDRSDKALFMDARQKSFNQLTADKVNKRDLVINFRKPTACQLSLVLQGASDGLSFLPQARGIIRDYLSSSPGATKDRIYDELVSRMVRLGTMEAHDFDGLLQQVAEAVRSDGERLDRWYLRETELAIEDAAESAKEDGAAASFHEFITAELRQHAGEEGVHYSDLFEHYVYAVKDKPRRLLAEWLPDYFFKTEVGTWRLPASAEEEQLKASARAGGLSRRIKRYLAFLAQGVAVPDRERPSDATLAEWIRHSKRAGFYEQGRELYEHGGLNLDGLSEEAMVNVEEDYQVCVRMLGRVGQGDGKAPKRRGKGPGAQGELFQ